MNNTPCEPRAKGSLICDARHPLVGGGKLLDEFILYALDKTAQSKVCSLYGEITGNPIRAESRTDILSGGQKVLLMLLLALHSPARDICFIGLERALDTDNRAEADVLIKEFGNSKNLHREAEL